MQDLQDFRYFAGDRDRGGWTFSGEAFGWGFRVGREDYVRTVTSSSQRIKGTFLYVSCREDYVSRPRLSSQEHLYMGLVVQGKCSETRGQRQGGGGVRSTGFGRNRVLRDRNLFILQGFEGAKCRI